MSRVTNVTCWALPALEELAWWEGGQHTGLEVLLWWSRDTVGEGEL